MSDETEGWTRGDYCDYWKIIEGERYEIHRGRNGLWWVWNYSRSITGQLTLVDAKFAAHDHARARG